MMLCNKPNRMLVIGMALGVLCGAMGFYLVSGVEAYAQLGAKPKKRVIGFSTEAVLQDGHFIPKCAAYILYDDGSIEKKSIPGP